MFRVNFWFSELQTVEVAASNHIDKLSRFYFWQTRKVSWLQASRLLCCTFRSANVVVVTVVTRVGAI